MGWSNKYKKSIDCNNPKGFSQKAHCAGRKKRNEMKLKISQLKEIIKRMAEVRGPSRGFNKLASTYQKEAHKVKAQEKKMKKAEQDMLTGLDKEKIEMKESINEGPSTEEKRIAMLAVRKQAKYRNVDLASAIQDQINALKELQRDVKRGKIKK